MDALALLCNLYGDGPSTLRRLREAGCATFTSLERIAPEDLAQILGATPLAARRFQREARLLLERAGEVLADEESSAAVEGEQALQTSPGADGVQHEMVFERALAVWRTWDRGESGADALRTEVAPRGARRDDGADGEAPAPEPPGRALVPELIDGLDSEWCLRLREYGVETAEELAACDALELARAMDAPLTRLMRLQALARRVTGVDPSTLAAPSPSTLSLRFSPDPLAEALEESEDPEESESGPEAHAEPEEASGPFA